MPLILLDEGKEGNIILNEVSFHIDNGNYFKVASGDCELIFEYIPKFGNEWDYSKYELFLFDNPYFDAENDVFEICIKNQDDRAGWIFPITLLESNENDYFDHKNLNGYKFVAYHKLLRSDKIIQRNGNYNKKLTDIFNEKTKICLLSISDINLNSSFDINDFLLSFYSYGYTLQFDENTNQAIQTNWFRDIYNFRIQRKCLYIQRSSYDLMSNDYIFNIFTNHLLVTENYLVRFILLYQVIEELMYIESDTLISNSIERYKNNSITKNDFKTELNETSSESSLISSIFSKTQIESDLKSDFSNKCKALFDVINYYPKNIDEFSKILYSFRNLVTHNYRLLINEQEKYNQIISSFEFIVIKLLINYGKNLAIDNQQNKIEASIATTIETEALIPVEETKIKSGVEIIKSDIPEIKGVKVIGRIDLSKYGNQGKK